jgi:hypothetical protein
MERVKMEERREWIGDTQIGKYADRKTGGRGGAGMQ